MRCRLLLATAMLSMGLGACATLPPGAADTEVAMVKTVKGTLSYRERIALPPRSQLEIVVSDVTLGRDQELILSRELTMIDQASAPVPFSINVSRLNLSKGPLYALRAFIREPDGTILFRTGEPVLLDLGGGETSDIGTVMLSMTSSDDRGLAAIPGLQSGQWRVTQIGGDVAAETSAPTLSFSVDGKLQGSTSCNQFNGSYSLAGGALEVGTIATTRRACDPGVMRQERRFLDALALVEKATLEPGGFLVLSGNGQRLVAVRN